jgi:hypothetical protein
MSTRDAESDGAPGIGAGYAMFQLSKALIAEESDPDPQARVRAGERIARWQQVVVHAMNGTAQYGSRMPFADVPAWATLEVATGGFATGHLLAGGETTEDERALAASIPGIRDGVERLDLNAWHLSDAGIEALQHRLRRGDYRIDVPEEAALPTVAWLLGQGRAEEARVLIETIAPFFDRLRFFPPPAQGLPVSAADVHVFAAGDVRQRLATLPGQARLAAQKRAIEVRLPLYDAAIAQVLATYKDGWPCRQYPQGWHEQAAALCARFDATHQDVVRAGRTGKDRVAELFALLAQCARDPAALTGRHVGRIRRIVDDFVRKHGHPDSDGHRMHRAGQRRQVAAPAHHLIARAVSARLAHHPDNAGISDFASLSVPITAEEAEAFAVDEGTTLPPAIRRRLERCRSGTIAELIACGVITSGDTIARVLPALTAEISSAGFRDVSLRMLYAATYRAFRRRRSLLLLHLQHQVEIGELPWVAVVEHERQPDAIIADAARQSLVESAALTLSAFPYAIVPNKLLQEFRALANTAQLELPFVDEVAADIFMGTFSNKFTAAARRAARLVSGTLYARYYAIETDVLIALPDKPPVGAKRSWWQRLPSGRDTLAALCARRANAQLGTWRPAVNGTILEQQQILTTQNLAPLFGDLDLKTLLRTRLDMLALSCFEWICARQRMRIEGHRARLVMVKNTAYAWRQMLFYLSMLDEPEQRSAIAAIETHFAAQPEVFRKRFMPAMLGLRLAAAGQRLPQHDATPEGARVFLGWTTQPHWLLIPGSTE